MKHLPLIIISFVGVAVLMLQWNQRRNFEEQIKSAKSVEFSLSSRSQHRDSGPADLRGDVITGLADFLDPNKDEISGTWLNRLVHVLSDTTSEDLRTLISDIEGNFPADREEKLRHELLLGNLKRIRDELDPIGVLQSENRLDAFLALAKKSPDEAKRWLQKTSLPPEDKKEYLRKFDKIRFGKEPSRCLGRWAEIADSQVFDNLALLGPEGIADLMPVVNLPENSEIRENLIGSIIYSSIVEGNGLARSRIEALGIEGEEIIPILGSWDELGSEETLEWAIDLSGDAPERTFQLRESFMAKFAQQNLDRAGEWLGEFEGSPLAKDQLTGRFAMVLGSVDPEAALPWIESIQNEKERESLRRHTLMNWKIEDPQAFAEWQKK